jgi:hypothetical protein
MVGAREILEPRDCCARHRMTCCTLQLRLGPGVVERLRTIYPPWSLPKGGRKQERKAENFLGIGCACA